MADASAPAPMFPVDMGAAPKITLGGREWSVPVLAIKQNRIIVPALMKMLPLMAKISETMQKKDGDPNWFRSVEISTEDMDTLCDIAFTALTRGYKGVSRAEFDDIPISLSELLEAVPTIMSQTGTFTQRKAGEAGTGEAQATGQSTSTSSSPTTASPQASPGPTN